MCACCRTKIIYLGKHFVIIRRAESVLRLRGVRSQPRRRRFARALVTAGAVQVGHVVTKRGGQGGRCRLVTTDPPTPARSVTIMKAAVIGDKDELARLPRRHHGAGRTKEKRLVWQGAFRFSRQIQRQFIGCVRRSARPPGRCVLPAASWPVLPCRTPARPAPCSPFRVRPCERRQRPSRLHAGPGLSPWSR